MARDKGAARDDPNPRGQKDWRHNVDYELARQYNDMVLIRNRKRGGNGRKPKQQEAS